MTQRFKPDETLSLRLQQLIDSQCISYEDQLRSGSAPTIEEFIASSGQQERSELLYELLMIDLDFERRRGNTPSLGVYLQRFPEDEDTVRAAFDATLPGSSKSGPSNEPPKKISRYEIVRAIGSGSFGVVYEGFDPKLQRRVAIKVQRPHSGSHAAVELAEAQTIAKLTHPNIVPVFDVGSTVDYPCYIVSALIDGVDLTDRVRERRLTVEETVELVASLADALDYAHENGVIHRDIKPRNVLIDTDGTPFLVDFGLALREEDFATGPEMVGTPAYMSPEQAGGEGHRVDGRSDLFSLGSVLYELLTGQRPFDDPSTPVLLKMVQQATPPPLAESVAGLPKELQRVCSKAMARRVDDRYANGREFADDLRTALESEYDSIIEQRVPRGVVPRGLRSYGAEDADFFLQLLPGPRDRRGLSRLLKQLLSRIEATSQGESFATGIVFGPSGCGKSSLMKAGVLPRTNARVKSIYLEATATHTMADMRRLLKQNFELEDHHDLREMLTRLRRGDALKPGEKIVIVIDQFEQWLHVNPKPADSELVAALRQCDGGRLQCVLMVRDDFWFALNRFMRALEVPIIEGTNSFVVDLFDPQHAKRILTSFGQAFERVGYPPTPKQTQFVEQATTELLQGENISPVRLALFAEMMKGRDWDPETLVRLGGASGVGLRFFEETFDASNNNTVAGRNGDAVRRVLASLLPESDTDIKGSARSRSELLVQCEGKQQQLNDVVRILDRELRLITPVESDSETDQEPAFQLAHDYLVPSIRRWLARYQKETFQGRAEAKLIDRTAAWSSRSENQQLPSLWEYLNIRIFTEPDRWTDRQREMLSHARTYLLRKWCMVATILLAVGITAYMGYRNQNIKRTRALVSSFRGAAPAGVPFVMAQLQQEGARALNVIEELESDPRIEPFERYRLLLARSMLAKPDVPTLIDPESIRQLPAAECPNVVLALRGDTEKAKEAVGAAWEQSFALFRREFPDDSLDFEIAGTTDEEETQSRRIRREQRLESLGLVSRYAILLLHLGDLEPTRRMLAFAEYPERRSAWIYEFKRWHGSLTELAPILELESEPSLLSGLFMAIGATGEPTVVDKSILGPIAQHAFETDPDSGIHSAAEYLLTQWNIPKPALGRVDGTNWQPSGFGFTLARVPVGEFTRYRLIREAGQQNPPVLQRVSVSRPFHIATTEISVDLFLKFVDDPAWPASLKPAPVATGSKQGKLEEWHYHEGISRTTDCPVQQVNFDDALLFCNWLSAKAQLTPCYSRNTNGSWEFDEQADGYRLPTEAEWEYAARAGTRTFWYSGQDEVVLQDYSVYARTTDYGTRPCGSYLPNAFGLFDTSGNVREWCWDRFDRWPLEPTEVIADSGPSNPSLKRRVRRGGCFTDRAEPMRNDRRASLLPRAPDSRSSRNGLRVARNAQP